MIRNVFSYELSPNEIGHTFYYVDFDWSSMIDETYGSGTVPVKAYDSANIFGYFDRQLFVQGNLSSFTEKYLSESLAECFSYGDDNADQSKNEQVEN